MKYALTQRQIQERETPTPPPPAWTDDRVEVLKTMWKNGKSFSEIARVLGGVTRNAVCGKINRLGLGGSKDNNRSRTSHPRRAAPGAFGIVPRPPKPPQKIKASGPTLEIVKPPRPSLVEPLPPLLQPDGRPRAIAEGPGRLCAWIDADPRDPQAAFCGRPKLGESSFCEHHYHRVYQQLTPRQMAQRAEGANAAGGQLEKLAV